MVLLLASASSALAVGSSIPAGNPLSNQPPAVAFDSTGSAIVAWSNNASSGNFVQYCVIPAGGKACSHTGNLPPADGPAGIDGVSVKIGQPKHH